MTQIVDFQDRRRASLLAQIGNLAADVAEDERAEAELLGLDPDTLDEEGFALEHRRDEIADTLGMHSACSLRMIAMMLRGDHEMAAEEEQAIHYFRTWILGEAT